MASICSQHREYESDCRLCNTDIRQLLPNYDVMLAEAAAAGKRVCHCGYTYYRTTDTCPRCSEKSSDDE